MSMPRASRRRVWPGFCIQCTRRAGGGLRSTAHPVQPRVLRVGCSLTMAYMTLKSAYASLVDRLNCFPQGASPSETLFCILAVLLAGWRAVIVKTIPLHPQHSHLIASVYAHHEDHTREPERQSSFPADVKRPTRSEKVTLFARNELPVEQPSGSPPLREKG